MIALHNALFGDLAHADLSPLAGLFAMAPEKVVAFGSDQIFAHGETAEGIALAVSKKAYALVGTNGLMYAEDEYLRNPPSLGGKGWGLARRAYLIGAMRAARAGKRCGLYHLPYTNIDQRHAVETKAQNDAARDLVRCCEAAFPDIYMPGWNVADLPGGANFYAENVPGALAEACRIPFECGIPVYPFIQLWTTNAERDLTDSELAAISPHKLAAYGCSGAVLWGWSTEPAQLARLNKQIARAAQVWSEA